MRNDQQLCFENSKNKMETYICKHNNQINLQFALECNPDSNTEFIKNTISETNSSAYCTEIISN